MKNTTIHKGFDFRLGLTGLEFKFDTNLPDRPNNWMTCPRITKDVERMIMRDLRLNDILN